MANLYIMVGAPGSGKSTYVNNNKTDKDIWVSRDIIRNSILKDDEEHFSHEKQVYTQFVNSIQNGLDLGFNVYADATHLNEISRNKLLNRLRLNGINIIPINFHISVEECLRRNNLRTAKRACLPEKDLRNMYNMLNFATHNEKYKYKEIINIYE